MTVTGYAVNHNGTEDWLNVEQPHVRDHNDAVIFPSLDAALAFAKIIVEEVLAWEIENGGVTREFACSLLSNSAEGVPVQIERRTAHEDEYVGFVDPQTMALVRA